MPPNDDNRGQASNWRARALLGPRRAGATERPIQFKPARPNGGVRARAVGGWVPGLTKKVFEKYGFSTASLITDWGNIVGEQLALACEPERLKWPRPVGMPDGAGETDVGRPGATLILRVDPARALEVEYQRRQIIERVNVFFGYKALADMRIIQAPLLGAVVCEQRRPKPAALLPPSAEVAAIEDEGLRDALARLASNVKARNPT